MTTQTVPADIQARLQNIHIRDIQKLVAQRGKIEEGNKEITLKEPSTTDSRIQAILNDPACELKPIKPQASDNEMYYDLRANGRNIRLRVACQARK